MTPAADDTAVTMAAADWYARLHVEDVTPEDRLAFARWEAADPRHARAWKTISRASTGLERDCGDRDDPAVQAVRAAVRRRLATDRPRFAVVAAAAAVAMAVAAAAVGLIGTGSARPVAMDRAMDRAVDRTDTTTRAG
ncbi:FecR/PupR family sigma factor regulator [Sphingomonas sp. Leaf17]|uniref:FecR/PupR family sigma factor regulator n=1 Tax=Sphingomonas sp. Leaf17 TaxID=1735683 RepID=UPI002E132D54